MNLNELWRKSLSLWEKAQSINETITRDQLAEYLSISDRTAGNILFALRNRNLINCESKKIAVNDGVVELALGDLHIPFQDDAAVDACLSYADNLNPSIISIMGDMLDFYQISTFSKNPIRSKRLFEEIKQGKEFLTMLRERYPQARIIYYEGNHENRLSRYILQNAPQLAELLDGFLPDKLGLESLNIEYHTVPFAIGKLWHLHGHEKGAGSYNPEYITNVMMQYIYDHYMVWHYHRSQDKTFKRIADRYWQACSVGHLAGEMDYALMNKWQQGFAIVRYMADGEFSIDNKKIIRGVVY